MSSRRCPHDNQCSVCHEDADSTTYCAIRYGLPWQGGPLGPFPGTCRPPLTGVNHTHLRATRPRLRRHPTHFIGAPVWTFSELASEAGGLTRRSRGPSDLGRAGARAVWPGSPPRVGVKGLQRGIIIIFSRFAAFGCGQRAAPGAKARREQRELP